MYNSVQKAINEIASDDDAFNELDIGLGGGRGEIPRSGERGGLADCRSRPAYYNAAQQRLELNYDGCSKAVGNIYVSREGQVPNKYYLVDFQDNFSFAGLDIDGEIELERAGGLRDFELRIGSNRRLEFGREADGPSHPKLRALLFITAAYITVTNDVVEVTLPRDGASGIAGDASNDQGQWSGAIQLGDRFLELFTTETGDSKLSFPRDLAGCLCPTSGPLNVSGPFENIALQFKDTSGGIPGMLGTELAPGTLINAFKQFELDINIPRMDIGLLYQFGTCGNPGFSVRTVPELSIPIRSDDGCLLPNGEYLMQRVDEVMGGVSGVTQRRKNVFRSKIEGLFDKGAEEGCVPVSEGHVKERVKQKLENLMDWSFCTQ